LALTWALWATILSVGIFVGLALGDATALEAMLWRWQTLVAGILAIAAALFTMNEMRRIEEKQQRRHDELMSLNLAGDRLRVARVSGYVPFALEHPADGLIGCADKARSRPSHTDRVEAQKATACCRAGD